VRRELHRDFGMLVGVFHVAIYPPVIPVFGGNRVGEEPQIVLVVQFGNVPGILFRDGAKMVEDSGGKSARAFQWAELRIGGGH
jgi:hypothetical protein